MPPAGTGAGAGALHLELGAAPPRPGWSGGDLVTTGMTPSSMRFSSANGAPLGTPCFLDDSGYIAPLAFGFGVLMLALDGYDHSWQIVWMI